jgi:hypothetical protein
MKEVFLRNVGKLLLHYRRHIPGGLTVKEGIASYTHYTGSHLSSLTMQSLGQDTERAGFEVFTAVIMKNAVFWYVASCRSCEMNRRFEGTYRLHLQGTCSLWFLARGFFYPEDGGDMFLRNVGSFHRIYMAPHPRSRHSSRYTTFPENRLARLSQSLITEYLFKILSLVEDII